MKTFLCPRSAVRGSVLLTTMVIIGVTGLVLLTYLTLVRHQNVVVARSQSWNTCIAIAEAGVEDALAHLNKNGVNKTGSFFEVTDLASQGWISTNGQYYVRRAIDDCYYEVYIKEGARPVITATGYVPAPANFAAKTRPFLAAHTPLPWDSGQTFLSRTVQAKCRAVGRFTKAIVARDKVELNGKYIIVDSYHAYDPAASTYDLNNPNDPGQYDVSKRQDNGDVAVMEGMSDELKISDAEVWGKVATGPDGNLKTNKSVVVGSIAWHDSGQKGVEPGWATEDASFDMPSVTVPFAHGFAPSSGTVGTNTYDYILGNDDYEVSQLGGNNRGKVLVTGTARILVTSKIDFSDDPKDEEGIEFEPGARLEIYMKGKDAKLVGKKQKKNQISERMGFNKDGNTTNFFYFGSDKNEKLELKNMDEFVGLIYAPNAEITLKAGNLKYLQVPALRRHSG